MQIDNDTLQKLSAMSNEELKGFISKVAGESGLSTPSISQLDIGRIRSILYDIQKGDPDLMKKINSISKSIKKDGNNSHH